MTPFDRFLEFLVKTWRVDVWIVAKLGMLLLLVLYLIFSLVAVTQVNLMCRTVRGLMDKSLMIAARALVGLAVLALVLGIVIL